MNFNQAVESNLSMICLMLVCVLGAGAASGAAQGEFRVDDFGARADGTKCTAAFASAIAAAAEAGGGRVRVPSGRWFTGAIHLRSNVELALDDAAEIEFSDDPADYLPAVQSSFEGVECLNYSPLVYAFGCTNVAITGRGTLRAKMDGWLAWGGRRQASAEAAKRTLVFDWGAKDVPVAARDLTRLPGSNLRPPFLQFNRCAGVRLENVRIRQSPFWTIHVLHSEDITLRGLDVSAHSINNSDGANLECSRHVLIEDCVFEQGDDVICCKSGCDRDGLRRATPTEDVTVRRCRARAGHGFFTMGSECSGGIRNVRMEDCAIEGECFTLLNVKTRETRGGFIENVTLRNVQAKRVTRAIVNVSTSNLRWAKYQEGLPVQYTAISNLLVENVSCEHAARKLCVQGDPHAPVAQLKVRRLKVGRCDQPDIVEQADIEYALEDFQVYVPKAPWDASPIDPMQVGDRYNDHFQVIWDPTRRLYYAFWTQATREGAVDMHVVFSKSADRGQTWTPPRTIAGCERTGEPKSRACWQQPMLAKSGRLYCLWNQQGSDEALHHGLVAGAYSDDAGETWSAPEVNRSIPLQMRDDPSGRSLPNWCNWQRPLRLGEGGRFLVGCTRHVKKPDLKFAPNRPLGSWVEFWQYENIDENPAIRDIRITVLSGGEKSLEVAVPGTDRFCCEEASLAQLPDGRLFALMRTRARHPFWSQSFDHGRTWSKPQPLRDASGQPYLHPNSPCPLYSLHGPEATDGEVFALIHNAYDDSIPPLGRQERGTLYRIRGTFDPNGAQPIRFGKPEPYIWISDGNACYSSYTEAEGETCLWFGIQKYRLVGRKVAE